MFTPNIKYKSNCVEEGNNFISNKCRTELTTTPRRCVHHLLTSDTTEIMKNTPAYVQNIHTIKLETEFTEYLKI